MSVGAGSGRPRAPRRRRTLALAPVAILLLTFGIPFGGGPTVAPTAASLVPLTAPSSACGTGAIPTNFTGSLVDQGTSPTPPSVANRTVDLSYLYVLNFTPKTGGSTLYCRSGLSTATTDSVGGFTATASVPTSSCTVSSCSYYSGPYGPANFSVAGGAPPAYFLTAHRTGTVVGLAFVEALSDVALTPSIRVTLSTDAPTVIAAVAQAGNGAPSPASVGYAWQLNGNGWSVLHGAGSPNLTIEAVDGATPGVLSLWVNGTFNGTSVVANEVQLDLAAVTTTAAPGQANPTSTDVGLPVTFTVTGTGAYGYEYFADLRPGLGTNTTSFACASAAVAGGQVDLTCSGSATYATPGTAQPSGNLTNGFSRATVAFAAITVAPALVLAVQPTPALAYNSTPFAVTVRASSASGTSPFGIGCLSTGDGRTFCDNGPGPSYPFSVIYGAPGTFAGRASVVDEVGANATTSFVADIVARPHLAPLVASTNSPGEGTPVNFAAEISGGALPLDYWWNETTGAQTVDTLFAGSETVDGPMTYAFVPYLAGAATIKLTVLDRLGTVEASSTNLTVGPGNPSAFVASGPEDWTVTAGAPYTIDWRVVDGSGNRVPLFDGEIPLSVVPPSGGILPKVWVNQSYGPVPYGAGSFHPVISQGELTFTVAVEGAGSYGLEFASTLALPGGSTAPPTLTVTPELTSARLTDPVVVEPGSRSNATLWRLTDRFGDAFVGADVDVRTTFGGSTSDHVVGAIVDGNATWVWVNYSAPGSDNGTVVVLGNWEGREVALKTIVVPALLDPWPYVVAGAAAVIAAPLLAIYAVRRRRARVAEERPVAPAAGPPATEAELQRLAEGREHILARASADEGRTLDQLAQGFPGSPPTPEEITEWVASLLADGSLRTALGPDGRSRFFLVAPVASTPPPRVELDDRALEEALKRFTDDEEPPARDD